MRSLMRWLQCSQGKSGFLVYKFRLVRRPGQPELTSSTVDFGHGSIPKGFAALRRPVRHPSSAAVHGEGGAPLTVGHPAGPCGRRHLGRGGGDSCASRE